MAYPQYGYSYPGYNYQPVPQPMPQPMQDPMAQMRQNQQPMQPNMMQQNQQIPSIPNVNQVQQPTFQFGTQSNGINWVDSYESATKWPILPGNAVALWDQNAPVVYLRQADNTGKPSTIVYDLVERTDEQRKPQQTVPQIDTSQFVTWDGLDERIEQIVSERLKKPAKTSKLKEDKEDV